MDDVKMDLADVVERLNAAATALEQAAGRMQEQGEASSSEMTAAKIVATVASAREEELEQKLAEAEATIAELKASASGRKTAGVGRMFAKAGVSEPMGAEALDGALGSLTVEQRIAVKAELMRVGLAG